MFFPVTYSCRVDKTTVSAISGSANDARLIDTGVSITTDFPCTICSFCGSFAFAAGWVSPSAQAVPASRRSRLPIAKRWLLCLLKRLCMGLSPCTSLRGQLHLVSEFHACDCSPFNDLHLVVGFRFYQFLGT